MTLSIKNITRFLSLNSYLLKKRAKTAEKEQQEDFLKKLYHLGGEIATDEVFQVAKQLNISLKTIPTIIGLLVLHDEITTEKTFKLTSKGKEHALRLIRAHRIYEQYLAEHSGYAPSEWHEKANRMEHHISDEEQKRIASLLGNPLFDPHGDPIPTQSLELIKKEDTSLPFRSLSWWRITHVEDDDKPLFLQISETGLTKDSIIFITKINNHSFSFRYEGETFSLPIIAQDALNKVEISTEEASKHPETKSQRLTRIEQNQKATIVGLSPSCRGALRRRLMDLGFVKGSVVCIDLKSPMNNPIAYVIRGTAIALRHDQARYILIKKEPN